MISQQVRNDELIGRLKSNLYNFVDGHIYYINKVIKIRYDLIEKPNAGEIKENLLFDYYVDIIRLDNENQYILSGFPLITCAYNKLAYLIKNKSELKPDKLLILPYLHERKIYLDSRVKENQFYTITEHNERYFILMLNIADLQVCVYTETGIMVSNTTFPEI
jgi:hypothetical protein